MGNEIDGNGSAKLVEGREKCVVDRVACIANRGVQCSDVWYATQETEASDTNPAVEWDWKG
jgi:hypothetical protein